MNKGYVHRHSNLTLGLENVFTLAYYIDGLIVNVKHQHLLQCVRSSTMNKPLFDREGKDMKS